MYEKMLQNMKKRSAYDVRRNIIKIRQKRKVKHEWSVGDIVLVSEWDFEKTPKTKKNIPKGHPGLKWKGIAELVGQEKNAVDTWKVCMRRS